MTRVRQALAVALVATALCADGTATAAPVERAQPEPSVATKLVEHLVVTFQRLSPAVRFNEVHPAEVPVVAVRRASDVQPVLVQHTLSPFQYRLPPPAL